MLALVTYSQHYSAGASCLGTPRDWRTGGLPGPPGTSSLPGQVLRSGKWSCGIGCPGVQVTKGDDDLVSLINTSTGDLVVRC